MEGILLKIRPDRSSAGFAEPDGDSNSHSVFIHLELEIGAQMQWVTRNPCTPHRLSVYVGVHALGEWIGSPRTRAMSGAK